MNYYNEHDPKAAAWLRELIAAKLIPAGHVDERSITEIKPHELSEYTQCHFFAGIGGWSCALQLAGWPASRPVWTGSCPCQPFSAAGQNKGGDDPRHLWPAFFALIRECRPERVFGEQVASAIGHGWLDGISEDLESEGYACGAVVLGAHSVGAPHIRQRLYWMADAGSGRGTTRIPEQEQRQEGITEEPDNGPPGTTLRVADAAGGQREQCLRSQGDELQRPADNGADGGMGNPISSGQRGRDERGSGKGGQQVGESQDGTSSANESGDGCEDALRVDKPALVGPEERTQLHREHDGEESADGCEPVRMGITNGTGRDTRELATTSARYGNTAIATGFWDNHAIVHCRDGKARRFEPGSFPLAHGLPGRVGLLRGYGNAIVPQVAAEFVMAFVETDLDNRVEICIMDAPRG